VAEGRVRGSSILLKSLAAISQANLSVAGAGNRQLPTHVILSAMIVRILRWCFRWWPFMHGRGWILRLARLLLGRGAVRFDIGGGTFIEGPLDDWMILWAFMRQHERDAPFQCSLDLLRDGDVALDIGANLGIWSLLAAKRGARVHAFEPVPEMVARLRHHARLSGAALTIHPFALGAEAGSLPFFAARDGNTGASSFARRSVEDEEIRVPVETLDGYVERHGIPHARMLKVDVEGAEILVFRGARKLLSSGHAPSVFFEVDEELCARFGTTPQEVKQFLVDCGYRIYRRRRNVFAPVSVDEPHGHEDLFALKS
jgi:FkbM family methyltransferase